MNEKKEKSKAFIGTLLFHAGLLLLMIFLGLRTPLPLPGEEGVEVNLGNSETGWGNVQPEKLQESSESAAAQEEGVSKEQNKNEQVITSEDEESVKLEKTQKAEQTKQKSEDKKENIKEQEAPKVNPKALYKGKGEQTQNTQSQGIAGGIGDQGKETGNAGSNQYDGLGGLGNGTSYSLGGRAAKHIPLPSYSSDEQGKIVVKIWVDKYGNVTKAISGAKGTTIADPSLRNMAQKAALRAKFSTKLDAPEEQIGTITYNFIKQN